MGLESTCVIDMCLPPKKGYSYIEVQSLYAWIKTQLERRQDISTENTMDVIPIMIRVSFSQNFTYVCVSQVGDIAS